jgi:hypothetical protein
MEGLAKGDSEAEDDENDREAERPASQLGTPPAAPTRVTLGLGEGHGA